MTFFYAHDWSWGLLHPHGNLEVGQQQAREELFTGAYRTTSTSKACVTLLKSWDMRICEEKTAKQNTNGVTWQQSRGSSWKQEEKGAMTSDLPRSVLVDHSPFKPARTGGPIVWVLPAELTWEWFLARECHMGNWETEPYVKESRRTVSGKSFWGQDSEGSRGRRGNASVNTSHLIPSLLTTLLLGPRDDYQILGITKKCSGICSIPEVFESVLMLL